MGPLGWMQGRRVMLVMVVWKINKYLALCVWLMLSRSKQKTRERL